jgi:hypothetical protein
LWRRMNVHERQRMFQSVPILEFVSRRLPAPSWMGLWTPGGDG